MSFAPYAALWFLLIAAAGACSLAGRRSRVLLAVTLVVSLLAFVLWFLFRPDGVTPAWSIAGRQWAIGNAAWHLTGIVLLLALADGLHSVLNQTPFPAARQSAITFALAAAVLPVVWAADDRTRMMGTAVFAVAWAVAYFFGQQAETISLSHSPRPDLRFAAAIFPLWLASVVPAGRFLFGVFGAALLLGIWPFDRRARESARPLRLVLDGLPVVAGGALLAATIDSTVPGAFEIAVGTSMGLISLVVGVSRVWEHSPLLPARAIGLGLAGLVLTAAIWAGQEALLAGIRLAVFVPALLAMTATIAADRRSRASDVHTEAAGSRSSRFGLNPGVVTLVSVYLAVAGIPLAVGFATLAPLYEGWRSAGGWILMIVVVVLMSFLLAAVAVNGRSLARTGPADRDDWLRGAVLLLPLGGLLSLAFSTLDVGWLTWVAIAAPSVLGLILGRYAPGLDALGGLLREAVAKPQMLDDRTDRLRRASHSVGDALADALAILEGEHGLLWLLGLILLLLWIA